MLSLSRAISYLTCLLVLLGTRAHGADHVPWVDDLAGAQQLAASKNMLVLLHFSADDCPPCRQLERKVFSKRTFGHAVGELFVPVNVNVNRRPELKQQFNITAWPTDVVITPAGQEVHRMTSPQDMTQYLTTLRQVVWRYKTTAPGAMVADYPLKKPSSVNSLNPSPLQTQIPNPTTTNALAQTSSVYGATPVSAPPIPTATTSNPATVQNMYVSGQAPVAPPADSFYATPPQIVTPNTPGPTAAPAASPPAAQTQTNLYAPQNNAVVPATTPPQTKADAGVQPATNTSSVTAQAQRASAQMQQPEPAQPRMGLEGFCPVTLLENEKWTAGDAQWGARHRGRVYLFQTAAAQQRFLAEPDRYSPVLSGFDPLVYLETGQLVEGNRAHGLRYQQSIVLFSSEESLSRFTQDPKGYLNRLNQLAAAPGQTTSR